VVRRSGPELLPRTRACSLLLLASFVVLSSLTEHDNMVVQLTFVFGRKSISAIHLGHSLQRRKNCCHQFGVCRVDCLSYGEAIGVIHLRLDPFHEDWEMLDEECHTSSLFDGKLGGLNCLDLIGLTVSAITSQPMTYDVAVEEGPKADKLLLEERSEEYGLILLGLTMKALRDGNDSHN
jgi:hypothetical protein